MVSVVSKRKSDRKLAESLSDSQLIKTSMASRSSRRRQTLSSLEIESFLSDLEQPTKQIDVENHKENYISTSNIVLNLKTDPLSKTYSDILSCSVKDDTQKPKSIPFEEMADEELIRRYCAVVNRHGTMMEALTDNNNGVVDMGRVILERTKYRLVPHIITNKEQYTLPMDSSEARKSILISLAPQIAEAEKQRKAVEELCTTFTGCSTVKSKSGRKSYEYVELQSKRTLTYKEYEQRYYNFLESSRVKYESAQQSLPVVDSISQFDGKPATTIMESNVENPEPAIEIKMEGSEISCEKEEVKKPVKKTRRETLSPHSAREMMLFLLDDKNNEPTAIQPPVNIDFVPQPRSLLTPNADKQPCSVVEGQDYVEEIAALMEFNNELDAIFCEGNINDGNIAPEPLWAPIIQPEECSIQSNGVVECDNDVIVDPNESTNSCQTEPVQAREVTEVAAPEVTEHLESRIEEAYPDRSDEPMVIGCVSEVESTNHEMVGDLHLVEDGFAEAAEMTNERDMRVEVVLDEAESEVAPNESLAIEAVDDFEINTPLAESIDPEIIEIPAANNGSTTIETDEDSTYKLVDQCQSKTCGSMLESFDVSGADEVVDVPNTICAGNQVDQSKDSDREAALSRLSLRIEIARWKFHWEVVSAQAAKLACAIRSNASV